MHLLIGFYEDEWNVRTTEYLTCIQKNIQNSYIDSLTVFVEYDISLETLLQKYPIFKHEKCKIILHKKSAVPIPRWYSIKETQPALFSDLFSFAKNNFPPETIIGMANSDIFFDDSLSLINVHNIAGKMLCLSRWDETDHGLVYIGSPPAPTDRTSVSQDAWIFKTPIPDIKCDFYFGEPGCDNRFAYEANKAGLAVTNPSKSIITHHLHKSGRHPQSENDRTGHNNIYLFVPESFINE